MPFGRRWHNLITLEALGRDPKTVESSLVSDVSLTLPKHFWRNLNSWGFKARTIWWMRQHFQTKPIQYLLTRQRQSQRSLTGFLTMSLLCYNIICVCTYVTVDNFNFVTRLILVILKRTSKAFYSSYFEFRIKVIGVFRNEFYSYRIIHIIMEICCDVNIWS